MSRSINVIKNYPIGKKSMIRTGGNAKYIFYPQKISELFEFLLERNFYIENKPNEENIFILGGMSNVLIRDGGINGLVINLKNINEEPKIINNEVIFHAGTSNFFCSNFMKKNNISGYEFLTCIPGTIGGAIFMNAGANGNEISNLISSCDVINKNLEEKKIFNVSKQMSYRNGGFNNGEIIIRAAFKIEKILGKTEIEKKEEEYIKYREKNQEFFGKNGTFGSAFKNPDHELKAWQLIEMAGLRETKRCGAEISKKHANFLINTGYASANDIEKLGEIIREKVFEKFSVLLEWEVKILGEKEKTWEIK